MTTKLRQTIIHKRWAVAQSDILEIGALDRPTFSPHEVNISFLDWFKKSDLATAIQCNTNRSVDNLVDVDYVIQTKLFCQHIPVKFDLVIANHVIEHIPDMLGWISQLESLTKENGGVFLSIPDKRFTFDYLRPCTDLAELIRCQDANLEMPDVYQLFRAFFYHRPIKAADAWSGDIAGKLEKSRYSAAEALARARAVTEYTDVHCSTFTSETFGALWKDIESAGLTTLTIDFVDDVAPGDNEFHVVLRKAAPSKTK